MAVWANGFIWNQGETATKFQFFNFPKLFVFQDVCCTNVDARNYTRLKLSGAQCQLREPGEKAAFSLS